MKIETTNRGFGLIKFKDYYGIECSMQDSSLATTPCIWFGVDNVVPKICIKGQGWIPYPIPDEVLLSSRMHLSQDQVKELLPYLIFFAETGKYLTEKEE